MDIMNNWGVKNPWDWHLFGSNPMNFYLGAPEVLDYTLKFKKEVIETQTHKLCPKLCLFLMINNDFE